MNQQSNNMYGSTAACSVNVPSTSSLPHQQASSGGIPNAPMYYVPQISTDPYGQQLIQYADSFGQEKIYPSNEMYASPNNTYARLPNAAYSYSNAIPSGQNDFAPQFQSPSLANQNNSTAAQLIQQPQFGAGQQQPAVHSLMHQPPPKGATYAKRGPESQTYSIGYGNNSIPAFNSPTAQLSYPPQMNQQKAQNQHPQNNGNGNANNGQDQRSSRLFDNTADNYTASWVSSTSSIPADQKIPPDHNDQSQNSPTTFEFSSWNAELSKINDNSAQNATMAVNNQQVPSMQQAIQQTHAYAGQPVPQMAYYTPNQPQFAPPGGMGYYPMQMPTPYIGFPPQYVMPNALPTAIPNYSMPTSFGHQQFVSPALVLHQPPLNPLWPPDARPLENNQDNRFENTWLDQNKCTQQELDLQRELIPFALEHNQRQFNTGNSGSRNGLLSSITQQHQSLNGGNESGYGDRGVGNQYRKPFIPKRGGGNNRIGGGQFNNPR